MRVFLYAFESGGVSRDTAALFASRTALALLGGFDDGGIISIPRAGAFRVSGSSAIGSLGGGLGRGLGGGNSGITLDRIGGVGGGVITGGFGVFDEELDCPAGLAA